MQNKTLYRTTQHLESRNHQSSDWQTKRLIPRPWPHPSSLGVSVLRIGIEEGFLPCLFPFFDPFPCLCSGYTPCLLLCRAGKGENHPYGKPSCLLTSPSCFSFLQTTKLSPLLATIRDLALVHCRRMLFRSFWIVLCLFLFPLLLLTWRPLNGLDCQAHSVSSHVQKCDLSSST